MERCIPLMCRPSLPYSNLMLFIFFSSSADVRDLHSFPTRRSSDLTRRVVEAQASVARRSHRLCGEGAQWPLRATSRSLRRSEEHTSELQSLRHLVCRLLLEKKNAAD